MCIGDAYRSDNPAQNVHLDKSSVRSRDHIHSVVHSGGRIRHSQYHNSSANSRAVEKRIDACESVHKQATYREINGQIRVRTEQTAQKDALRLNVLLETVELQIEQRPSVEINGIMDRMIVGVVDVEYFDNETNARLRKRTRSKRKIAALLYLGIFEVKVNHGLKPQRDGRRGRGREHAVLAVIVQHRRSVLLPRIELDEVYLIGTHQTGEMIA